MEPVSKVILRGTKVKPATVGTGTFLRPVNVAISSRYGYRWGRMHPVSYTHLDSDNSDFRHGSGRNIRRSCGVSSQDSEAEISSVIPRRNNS